MAGVTPGFIFVTICLSLSVIFVKKEHTIVPLVIAMCFFPSDISINIGPIHLYGLRLLALLGFIKILSGPQEGSFKRNTIDNLFIAYNVLGSIIYIIASENSAGAFFYKCGVFVDSVMLYFVLRYAIRSEDDVKLIIRVFCYCIIALLPFAIFEFFFTRNLFSFLGRSSIVFRNGEIRAATTFSHAILFGSFAAALIPMFWGGYKATRKKLFLFSICCCLFFIIACSSSSPLIAFGASCCLLYFFKWKQYSSLLAKFTLFTATFIHFARESPLWHFIYMRVSVKASSTGQHRYMLVDASVKEFQNWWIWGYGDVGPQWHLKYWSYTHAHFTDVTNHYLLEGVRGGFLTMVLFVYLCYKSVKALGCYSITRADVADQWLWWGFAIMMIAHCITFLSVAYFGQITMLLYMTIAVAAISYDKLHSEELKKSPDIMKTTKEGL